MRELVQMSEIKRYISENVRVLNTTTQELGNVVHRRSEYNVLATKCKVHTGAWTLCPTADAVSCSTCHRRMGRSYG